MDVPRIAIITASVREGRAGQRVADWAISLATARTDLIVAGVDLKDWPLPHYAYAKNPKQIERDYPDELPRRWVETVNSFDGFLVITPEYNHGYPASLKDALDYVYAGWNNKPIAFMSYGGQAGGSRSVEQLRQVVVELQMVPIRESVVIPGAGRAFGPDGQPVNPMLVVQAQNTISQLIWWAVVLKNGRQQVPLPTMVKPPLPPPTKT